MLVKLADLVLHLDKYLKAIVLEYQALTYVLIFLVLFCETGLVVMPFLPGDSLLFAAGALAANGSFDVGVLFAVVFVAAVGGDTVNYHLGKYVGPKVFRKETSVIFSREHLKRAQAFYEKHGKMTIILARFIPVIRTFAPFVAGVGEMSYPVFLMYNVIGGLIWSALFVFGGYLFGNIPWVQQNFSLVILVIILVSLMPLIEGMLKQHFGKKKAQRI